MRRTGLCSAGLLATQSALVAWQAWRYSPAIDEPAHLAAGISHWKFGRFELYRVNPPLVRMVAALPMLVVDPRTDWSAFSEAPYARSEFNVGNAFAAANGSQTFWHFTLARWACLPIIAAGGWYCYRFARELYGTRAGLVALALWCFCPNILGNGALLTPDAGAAAFGIAAGYYFWRWLDAPNWSAALAAGVALGLAELTKSTWVILFALWPLLWLIWRLAGWFSRRTVTPPRTPGETTPAPSNNPRHPASRHPASWLQLAAIGSLALYGMNLGYGFEETFRPLREFKFISQALGGGEAHTRPGNRFKETWLARVPVPVPANYLMGIDVQRRDFEVGKWSYLRGEQKMGGWWYYYLYALAVKVPHGTQLLFVLTCLILNQAMNDPRNREAT